MVKNKSITDVENKTIDGVPEINSVIDTEPPMVPNNPIEIATIEQPKLDPRFIVNIKGKDFVVYAGLLDLAHQKGFHDLVVQAIQYPNDENNHMAICVAVLTDNGGRKFQDFGDADHSNVNSKIRGHELRMASTRAKARVLRDFTNVGMTALEEIGDIDNTADNEDEHYDNRPSNVVRFPKKENRAAENDELTFIKANIADLIKTKLSFYSTDANDTSMKAVKNLYRDLTLPMAKALCDAMYLKENGSMSFDEFSKLQLTIRQM
ncbi:hypothetical protein M0R01_03640 [bacterium]|nr:hypothetical protein [bacterium]